MLLEEGSLCLINPRDEEPHKDELFESNIHYQHGNVKVTGTDVSVAFVFRVSPHTCKCNIRSNRVILQESAMNEIVEKGKDSKIRNTQDDRKIEYKAIDIKKYHNDIKSHFLITSFSMKRITDRFCHEINKDNIIDPIFYYAECIGLPLLLYILRQI